MCLSFPRSQAGHKAEQMKPPDIKAAPEPRRRPSQPANLARIERLLAEYPELNAEEEREIARYLRNPPLLDIEFLRENDALRGALERFEEEHRDAISPRPARWVASVTAAVVLLVGLAAFLAD